MIFQDPQDHQFGRFGSRKLDLLSSGTPKMESGRSNLCVGRWSRACPVGSDPVLKPKHVFDPFLKAKAELTAY